MYLYLKKIETVRGKFVRGGCKIEYISAGLEFVFRNSIEIDRH